jgi:Arc/MetJ-type ribon-helix-helix transcriptional regulator
MMRLMKRTYTLPAETLGSFETQVEPGRRSHVVSELIREWLQAQEREKLRQAVIEGCIDMAEIDQEVEREWHPLAEEVARAVPYED